MKVTPKKNIFKNIKGGGKVKIFTKGKIYTDISTDIEKPYKSKFYEIVNDLGEKEIIYKTSLFQTLSQKRNNILKELL